MNGSSVALGEHMRLEWSVARRRLSELASRRYFDRAVLSSYVLAITALNLLWVSLDSRPPYWDAARHLGDSLAYRSTFSFSHPLEPLQFYTYYPPFAYWVSDVFYAFFGTGLWVSILSESVFLAVLVFATYGIGKLLWNRRVGLLAALFVVTTPLIVSLFKWYMLDTPLTAMVALALYLLLRSEHFSDRRFSLLFGATCGLGTLTKWTFPLAMWLPTLVAVVTGLRSDYVRKSARSVVNIAGAGILAFVIASVWFIHNWTRFRADGSRYNARAADIEGDPKLRTLKSLLWYAWNLLDTQLYLIPFLLFAVGVIFGFVKNKSASRNFYPMLTIVGTYLAFTFLPNKDYRFTLPMLPAVAIVAVHWLEYLKPRTRQLLTGGIVAYGVVTFLAVSFGTNLLPKDAVIHLRSRPYTSDLVAFMPGVSGDSVRLQGITIFAQRGWLVGPPDGANWHQQDAFKEIAARSNNRSFYFSGGDSIWFNTWGTRYYATKYHETWVGDPSQAQFLVIRGDVSSGLTTGFAQIKEYRLPDNETLRLYQRA